MPYEAWSPGRLSARRRSQFAFPMILSNIDMWRPTAIVLAILCAFLFMQNRGLRNSDGEMSASRPDRGKARRGADPCGVGNTADRGERRLERDRSDGDLEGDEDYAAEADEDYPAGNSPLRFFEPRDGETMGEYRDRVVPIALLFVEPQRRRVAETRRRFEDAARLSAGQREEIDDIAAVTTDALMSRAMQALLSGEVAPPRVKPSAAVGVARDLLDIAHRAVLRFRDSLTDDQLEILAESDFDLLEYLLISTEWEGMLGYSESMPR